jgi:xylose isomerase
MRDELELARKAALYQAAGVTHFEFHSTEAPAAQAKQILKIVTEAGLKGVHMVTSNLFKLPPFVNGNYGNPIAGSRREAIEATKVYIRAGIEGFGANIYVYWTGSNGMIIVLGASYQDVFRWTADSINEICEWQVREFGWEKALPFVVEAKPNEPPSWAIPGDVGEVQSVISLMDPAYQAMVGHNIEVCHPQLIGKRAAIEMGQAAATGKLWYCHLNGGSGQKFDEDRGFGDNDISIAAEVVLTLQEAGYRNVVGLDVQPLPTDTNRQQVASIERSIRNLRRAIIIASRVDKAQLKALRAVGNNAEIAELWAAAVSGIANEAVAA